jgi:hypothetical protein
MFFVNVVAVNAFKRAYIEPQARWLSSCKHHLGLTFWAAMVLDCSLSKILIAGNGPQSCGPAKVINTDHHEEPACVGYLALRSRPKPRLSSTANPNGLSTPMLGPFL